MSKIAIAANGSEVSEHFGHCEQFVLVDIENNKVKNKAMLANPEHEPGFLPSYLADKGVSYIIAGGMGSRAKTLFEEKGVKCILGVSGSIDDVIDAFINGTLQSSESFCDH